jgi:hypothetical protein
MDLSALLSGIAGTIRMKALHVVITDFNGFEQTRRCLQALRESRTREFTIIVVDHGTTTHTRDSLASEFPEVLRIHGSPDLWWAGATNLGIQTALQRGAEAIMLLNNDCYVTADTLRTLVALSDATPTAIIAPVQRDAQTGKVTSLSPRTCFLLGFPTIGGPTQISRNTPVPPLLSVKLILGGRGAIIPAELFTTIGMLDEHALPHYGADHDFFLRARRGGIPLFIAPSAFVDIDPTRTSMANTPATLPLREFIESLSSPRSHRNLRDITALFRKHYPIPHLHMVGVLLYLARYPLVYLARRFAHCLVIRLHAR